MMKTSRNREPRIKIRNNIFYTVAIVCLLAIVLFFRTHLSDVIWRLFSPIYSVHGSVTVKNIFASKVSLENENTSLKIALASTTAALADRNSLYQENLDLKKMLGRTASPQSILATVIMKPPALPYDVLMIDIGQQNNVSQGDVVVAGGTTAIGTVSTIYATHSVVTLFSTPGQTYDAILHTQGGEIVPISVEGQGSGSLTAKVPTGTTVTIGDQVTLPNIQNGFIATVSSVREGKGQSFVTVYLQEPVNPLSLHYVEVWVTHA